MYFLIYNAIPNKGTDDSKKYSSANVACWINTRDRELAGRKSRRMVEQRGWTIDGLEEEHPLTRRMAEASTGLQYYEQALIDGEVLVFVTAPSRLARKK